MTVLFLFLFLFIHQLSFGLRAFKSPAYTRRDIAVRQQFHMVQEIPKVIATSYSSFDKIVENGAVYVDKTELIYSNFIKTKETYHFLVRPRRFGKSLLCSTLANMFLGDERLFRGLWLDGKWDFEKEKRCVIHLDMSSILGAESIKMFRKNLNLLLRRQARKFDIRIEDEVSVASQFSYLLFLAHQKTGKPVVVIIDEYDKPILDKIDDPNLAKQIREELQAFYGILKSSDSDLRLVFITGMLKFSQTSMFSTLNNLIDHSLSYNAGTLCGYTERELISNFGPYLTSLAYETGHSEADLISELKGKYNGYSFGINRCNISETVLNPFQINCALSFQNMDDDYWSLSGSSQLIVKKVLETGESLLGSKDTTLTILKQSSALESIPLNGLMYFGGYLTIRSIENTGLVRLDIPNNSIRNVLSNDFLMSIFQTQELVTAKNALLSNISSLMKSSQFSENDSNQFEKLLGVLYADIPYYLLQSEAAFRNVIDALLSMHFSFMQREPLSSKGRADTVILYSDQNSMKKIFIFEYKFDVKKKKRLTRRAKTLPESSDEVEPPQFKQVKISSDKTTAESAIAQIQNNEYDVSFRIHNVPIFAVGVAFSSERDISVVVRKIYK